MHETLRKFIVTTLAKYDVGVMRYSRQQELEGCEKRARDFDLLRELPRADAVRLLELSQASNSQFRQDLFVLSTLDFKSNGYFVEFGATDGVSLSNTNLLEKEFGWTGIVAEPAQKWHQALQKNRICQIDTRCVWKRTGDILQFHEAIDGEFSAIDQYSRGGRNPNKPGRDYTVTSISLTELLEQHGAPQQVDYLSIDTEGSEYEILSAFDFDKYEIGILTVEHNFQPAREKIFQLLTSKGYERRFERLSQLDDWYVRVS